MRFSATMFKATDNFRCLFAFAGVALLFCSVFAQDGISTREAGAYQRKSIAFLNTAVQTENEIPPRLKSQFVNIIQNALRFERFDYNNIPASVSQAFDKLPPSLSIEERMEKVVIPAVLQAVEAEKEIRAAALLSEQQRNSFITVKARQLGITEAELNAVRNAAYIFAPVYFGHRDTTYTVTTQISVTENGQRVTRTVRRRVFSTTLSAGGRWWKIDNSGENPTAKLIAEFNESASSSVYIGEPDTPANYRDAVFLAAARKIAQEIELATIRKIPDFLYTGQILNRNLRHAVISLGEPEGVRTDDKFRVIETREKANGETVQRKRGWVMVKKVGERARGLDSTQSLAQIIAGAPYVGAVVREIPYFPIDLSVAAARIPFSLDVDFESRRIFERDLDSLRKDEDFKELTDKDKKIREQELSIGSLGDLQYLHISNAFGPKIKVSVNPFTRSGVSQLWLNAGGGVFFGSSRGTLYYVFHDVKENGEDHGKEDREKIKCDIGGASFVFAAQASVLKKIFVRRLAFVPELGVGFKGITISASKTDSLKNAAAVDTSISLSQNAFGLIANVGAELAVTPMFHLGGSAGYQLYTRGSDTWRSSWSYLTGATDGESGSQERETHRGVKVKSKDKLQTSGLTWSAYASFTIPRKANSPRLSRNR